MAEQGNFKTTLMGGYDKDDVNEQFQQLQDEAAAEQLKLKKQISERDNKIEELTKRIELKENHQERLENEIQEKYQKYIDNYESIGKLVFDAQVKSEATVQEAKEKAEKILEEARVRAEKLIKEAEIRALKSTESIQKNIELKIQAGNDRYKAIQDEMCEVIQIVNEAQQKFMASYKEIHSIVDSMPERMTIDLREEDKDSFEPSYSYKEETAEEENIQAGDTRELHLGDTQELDAIDTRNDFKDLDEFDEKEEQDPIDEDEKAALQITRLLMQEEEAMMEDDDENF